MKNIIFLLMMLIVTTTVQSQKIYQTKAGNISFFSSTPLEDIEAVNTQVDAKLATNGQLVFMLLIKGFEFKNSKMQEHFNTEYMESSKFPKASFMGNIKNVSEVNFEKDGIYKTTVTGTLEIRGIKKPISTAGTIEVKSGKITSTSSFKIVLADYNIQGGLIGSKIAKTVDVTVNCKYN